MDHALPPMDVSSRVERLRSTLTDAKVDALLVTNLTNVRYLTGFTGTAGRLLVDADGVLFVTDGRYGEQATAQLADSSVTAQIEVAGAAGQTSALVARLGRLAGGSRLGLEAQSVTWAAQRDYLDAFESVDLKVVPTRSLVEKLREVKDLGEVARIESAAALADAALEQVRSQLDDGPTEVEFGLELDTAMRRLGADDISFETIVASGPNGSRPHHRPGPRPIRDGDLVVIDFGALVDGYHSDMTRTVLVGEGNETQRRMYQVVRDSQAAGVAAVRAGATTGEVDKACREVIADAGWADAFLHSTGHGVGLDIHEAPSVAEGGTIELAEGQVVTVEPGVYLPDHGGVRIEDTVVVTGSGCRVLTTTHRESNI